MRLRLVMLPAVALLLPAGASGATIEVQAFDTPNRYVPDSARIAVGSAVHWSTGSGSTKGHNVREDHHIFYSGFRTQDLDYTLVFSAGTFHYFCDTHGDKTGGMDGLVKVPVTITRRPAGATFKVKWASALTQTGAVFDVQYKIGSGDWKNWKANAAAFSAVLGKNGRPVSAGKGTRYSFRARSQQGDATSDWSPVESFTP